jgi:glycosyltransferase involved in cell wall biosynthesis
LRYQGCIKLSDDDKAVKTQPLITVITVVFNGARTLEQTILSVINQSYKNVEFIIIDGGSTDGTLDIIRKYEDTIDYWVSEQDKGIYDAMNKGIRCSTGDWICFLGADDYLWKNNVIERMVPTFISVPHDTKLVYGSVALINENGETILVVGEPWAAAKKKIADTMSLPHQGVMHHRTWFEQYGEFDISYRISGDYEMLLRGWPRENALFIPDFIISAMGQGGVSSNPRNSITILREARRAQKAHGIGFPGWGWLTALWRVYVRLGLQATLGERSTRRLLDLGRRILGKSPYWTKLS